MSTGRVRIGPNPTPIRTNAVIMASGTRAAGLPRLSHMPAEPSGTP